MTKMNRDDPRSGALDVAGGADRPGNKRIKLRHILPSLLTVFAICAGLTSVRMSIHDNTSAALYLIMLAVLLDGMDGKVARFFDTASPFGAELDTLADFFNFGIAPGILLYSAIFRGTEYESIGWLSCMVLAVCCALRLARFNIALDDPAPPKLSHSYFVGVPAPALACLALMPTFLILDGWETLVDYGYIVALYIVLVASLAVSTLPTFSIKHTSVKRSWLPFIVIGSVVLVMCLVVYPWITLVIANLLYLATLPLAYMRARRHDAM
ncbi:CDP-alcohol phosphatidyltransferase family protein [Tateyamaria sp.]|uniref:CDP-alcohol phosphatidyltransferase family protein n=1 Tax=Tateyamaria sp. TaxID=1929288 RepID=UPI0032A0A672